MACLISQKKALRLNRILNGEGRGLVEMVFATAKTTDSFRLTSEKV